MDITALVALGWTSNYASEKMRDMGLSSEEIFMVHLVASLSVMGYSKYKKKVNINASNKETVEIITDGSHLESGKLNPLVKTEVDTQADDVAVGSMNFMEKNDRFYKNALNRPDIDTNGYYDIIAHGTPNGMEMTINGKKQIVDHRMLSNILKNSSDYNGQNIRLLSCNTGAIDNGFAKNLSNKLNVEVLAPTDYLWAYPNGKMVVAPMTSNRLPDLNNLGTFRLFTPGK